MTSPRVIARVGRTPNSAAPVALHRNADGTLTPVMEGAEMLDFDSGEPIKLPANVTDEEAKAAIRKAGAVSSKQNFYAVKPGEQAPSAVRRIEGLSAVDRRYQGGDVLEEIGNAIEIARLKKSKDEGKLLDRFKEASKGKDYDTWRAEQEAGENGSREESPAEQPAASRATADAEREQEFVHNGVRIYPKMINAAGEVRLWWGVESAENKARREAGERHGFGDSLRPTVESAMADADRQIQRDAERAEFERRKTEIEAEKQAEAAARKADTINGFLDGKAPNTQELIRKALDKQYRFDGVIRSVREQVEWLDENGTLEVGSFDEPKIKPMSRTQFNRATQREQDAHEKKMREAGTKTVYLVSGSEIGKYAYDYAQHLIARKNSAVQQPAQPEQPAKRYAGPADVSSRAGQMELANRGGTIAALKAMNAQLRAIAPEEAWADANIEDAADLDALRDQISVALVRANRAGSAEQDSPLRKRLEEASGADLRAVFDALGLAGGARMIQADRVKALMSEDAQAVSDALDDVQSDGEPAAAEAPAQPPAANQPALTGPLRNPTQVSAFAPYAAGDIVAIDGKDWQVQQDMGGWYLTSTGNWRGMHPTIQKIRGMNELIAEIERAATAQPDAAAAAGQGGLFDSPAKEAANILDAAEVTGKERIDALKDIKAGTITTEELKDAYPAKIGARLDDLDAKFSAAAAADKNLIITHNLTAQNLLHAVKMGGLPVPSLAITKKDTPLTGFGEITLLGDSNLADPKGYASTKVYGADIYSPRYPSVERELDNKAVAALTKRVKPMAEKLGTSLPETSELQRDGQRELERSLAAMATFLQEQGVAPAIVMAKGMDDARRARLEQFGLGPFMDATSIFDLRDNEDFRKAALAETRDAYAALGRRAGLLKELDTSEQFQDNVVRAIAQEIVNDAKLRARPVADRVATQQAMEKQIADAQLAEAYQQWVLDELAKLTKSERIFQGFTNSGNRKYIPHTLENVVKLLKKELRGGESFNYGVGSLRAKFTPEFKSLAAIKKEKGRLVSAEQFEAVKKEVDADFEEVRKAINADLSNDTTIGILEDAAKMGVPRAAKAYGYEITEEAARKAAQFLTRLRNLPTAYFEAKVLRDVSLSEFKAAVVPEGSSKEVLDALKKAGIADIKTYERGNDASRAAAIQSFEDLRFSRRDAMDSVAEQGMPAHLVERYAKQYEAAGLHRVNVARNIGDLPARLQAKMSGAGDDVRGAYFRAEDQVWLFSDRLNSMDELHFVVIHEAFHRGLGHLFGEDGRKIMRQMYATNKALRDRADLVAKELKIDRDEAIEEALADMAGEGGVESLRGWKGLVQLIRKWLQGLATRLGVPLRFSDAQIRAFVAGVAGAGLRAQKAEPVLLTRERDMVMASREGQRDQTDTREFKRWFGDSKVVDAEGKPLVVYHGTAGNFSEFSPDFAGSTTYSASGLDGFFFTGDADTASKYAKVAQKTQHEMYGRFYSNANVMPVYLALNNPLVYRKQRGDASTLMDTLKRRVIADAKAAGNDGVVFQGFKDTPNGRGDSADVYVAFSPEQIKSAIGNSGAFDPENADIRFSRSSTLDAINQQAIRDKVSDLFSNAGEKVSWWDKTIGTQYNKAKKHPAFKKVFDHVQQYVEDTSTLANEAADKAPAILPKLESVRDVFAAHARGLSTEDKVAVAAPIFEGTLDWARIGGKLVRIDDAAKSAEQMSTAQKARRLVDDGRVSQEEVDRWEKSALPIYEGAIRSRYEQAYLTPGVVFNRQELRDLFKLNERQIEQYEQFRSAVNESLDQVATADALRLLGESPAELRAMAMGDRAAFRAGLVDYMEERIAEEEDTDVREQLRQTMADIEDKFNRVDDMKARGYAPLMRFGKFLVSVKGAEGEQEWFSLHETKAEANKMARELQGDPQFRGRVRQGVLSEEAYKLFSSIPVESLEMFAGALGAEKSAVFQEYLRMTKNNRSALKRLIQRKGTAGFSDEVSRVLASFVTSNARLAAGAMNMPAAKEAADAIRDGDLKDEGVKLIETVQNPTDTAGVLRGLMFTHFIGGSIASALVNVTQPVMMTLPWLSQWGGGAKAASRLMASARMAAGGKIADTELAKALERAEKDGIVSPQEIHHLTAEAMATWGKNPWLKRVAFIWSAPFSVAEQFNRRVSFLAAYKTAKEEGIADPFAFAQEAVVETQGLYNKGNSANWTRNPIGATALTFKQYSVHYLEWIKRMWNAGEPGSRERTEGRRAVLLAMALLFAAGGAEGLPFAEDLDDLADTIMQALGFDTSAKGWKREFIAKTLGLGDEGADVLMRGLSAVPGIPLDVSMRMGMGNLLPGTGMLLKSTTDASRDIAELAGPAGSLLTQWKDAGKKALDGDIPGAMLGAMPGAIQNMGKAASMWMNGEARDTKGRRIMQTDEIDGFMRFLGFNPSEIARESARLSEQDRRVRLTRAVESSIADQWAQGMRDGNADAVQEARAQLQEWNDTNPESRISISSAQIKRRLKDLGEDRSARFERATPKELRGSVHGALH